MGIPQIWELDHPWLKKNLLVWRTVFARFTVETHLSGLNVYYVNGTLSRISRFGGRMNSHSICIYVFVKHLYYMGMPRYAPILVHCQISHLGWSLSKKFLVAETYK